MTSTRDRFRRRIGVVVMVAVMEVIVVVVVVVMVEGCGIEVMRVGALPVLMILFLSTQLILQSFEVGFQ